MGMPLLGDVFDSKRILFRDSMVCCDKRQLESTVTTASHEEGMHSAVVLDFNGVSGFLLPSPPGWIFLINNSDMVRASLPGGLVGLRVDFASIERPLEHDAAPRNLDVKPENYLKTETQTGNRDQRKNTSTSSSPRESKNPRIDLFSSLENL